MCDLWICQESLKCRTSSDDLKAKWQYPNRFDKPHRSFQIVPADSKSQNTCMFEQKHPTANRNAQYCTTTVFLLKCTCCIIYIYIYAHMCDRNRQQQKCTKAALQRQINRLLIPEDVRGVKDICV